MTHLSSDIPVRIDPSWKVMVLEFAMLDIKSDSTEEANEAIKIPLKTLRLLRSDEAVIRIEHTPTLSHRILKPVMNTLFV